MRDCLLRVCMFAFVATCFLNVKMESQQDQLLTMGSAPRTLGTNRENMETMYYALGRFGWFGAVINERHDVWYYPTPADMNPAGYFNLSAHNAATADFNGDGREDLLITWAIMPHTIERQSRATFTILLNDGNGGLRRAPEMFEVEGAPSRFFAYRTAIADFNRDGRPDIVAAPMGMIRRNPDGAYTNVWEPIPLVLSTAGGKLRDASANIEGQENGGFPSGFEFGHDLSAGDVNGDGAPDFFTGKFLFLNDGSGRFTNASAQLPQEMRPAATYLMTSLIGDLNGDGIGDIVAAYANGAPDNRSGYILLSRAGDPSLTNRELVALPAGRYGAGTTKFNHGAIFDVNRDGLPDIVFSVTRTHPYYRGRTLQVLINKGNSTFADETAKRTVAASFLDEAQGEGHLRVLDVNRDGVFDLVHSGSPPFVDTGAPAITIYLNVNGVLRHVDPNVMAWVQPWQLHFPDNPGWGESVRRFFIRQIGEAFPIDLDKQGGIDFVSIVQTPLRQWPQVEPNEYTFYSVLSQTPLSGETTRQQFTVRDIGGFTTTAADRTGALKSGYARVQPAGASTTPSGLAIFSVRNGDMVISEAGVPASDLIRGGRIYAEVNGGVNTGIAIANSGAQAATVSFYFTDSAGRDFGHGSTTIPAYGKVAEFLNSARFRSGDLPIGTFTFSSSVPVAAIALRTYTNERSDFLITTLPVTPTTAQSGNLVFSHFADGGGWTTQALLVNPTDQVLTGSLQFFSQGSTTSVGQPLTLITSSGTASTFNYSIPARGVFRLRTAGASAEVNAGSVRVVPASNSSSPSGVSVFSFRNGGVIVTEAGVTASRTGSAFRLYVESSGAFSQGQAGSVQTGIAVANTSSSPATVRLELYGLDGASTGLLSSFTVPANGQTALFLNQAPGMSALPPAFQGILRVSGPDGISLTGLRGRYNERGDFLITVTPPVAENEPAPTGELVFPHIVEGAGYTTQFILFSARPGQNSSGTLQFLNQAGQALLLGIR